MFRGEILMEPNFKGYQLVGDSQLMRFSEQLLGMRRVREGGGPAYIGLCVSGQTVRMLRHRLVAWKKPLCKKIILMIGTNDIVKESDFQQMKKDLEFVVHFLKDRSDDLIIITLPPVPRLEDKTSHWLRLRGYNSAICRLAGDGVRICNATPSFHKQRIINMEFYERYLYGTVPDKIHLNKKGLKLLEELLCQCGLRSWTGIVTSVKKALVSSIWSSMISGLLWAVVSFVTMLGLL